MICILAGDSDPRWFAIAVLAILILYLLLSVPRRLARRSSILGVPSDAGTRLTLRLQDKVDRAELEILEIRQEFEVRCRNETQMLQALIAEAEDRIEELRILLQILTRTSTSEIKDWPSLLAKSGSTEKGVPELGLTGEQASTLRRLLVPDDSPSP